MKSDSVSRERNGTGTKQESLFAEEFGPIKQIKRLTFDDELGMIYCFILESQSF